MSSIDELIEELCPEGIPKLQLNELVTFEKGAHLSDDDFQPGAFPVVTASRSESRRHATSNVGPKAVTVTSHGAYAGHVNFWEDAIWLAGNVFLLRPNLLMVSEKFLFYVLKNSEETIQGRARGGGVPYMNSSDLKGLMFPIPPLEVQAEIVSILDKFTQLEAELEAELEARRIQYEVTRDRLLDFSGDLEGHPLQGRIPMEFLENVRLIRLADLVQTRTPAGKIPRSKFLEVGLFPIVDQSQALIAGFTDDESLVNDFEPCVVFGDHTREIKYVDFPFAAGADGTVILLPTGELSSRFLFYSLQSLRIESRGYNRHWSIVKELEISIPSLELQQEVVSILDKLDALVNDITIGLPAEIAARRKQYEYYRNKLLTFKELDAA